MSTKTISLALLLAGFVAPLASAQVHNLKVVTDANPDYSDMSSMVHSITSRWDSDKDKMYALFYWNHIARRQTSPMSLRGTPVTDPIRNYNDYGFMMCSTISGAQSAVWDFMGYKSRYFEIGSHTVCEVWYDNRWHHYDNSLSVHYTLCDGQTIAGIDDIGAELACEASGGKKEQGHIARYHALNGTSKNGFLEGSDWMRDLPKMASIFEASRLKHQYFYKDADYGHRWIFNLRPGESYSRFYHKLGDSIDYYVREEQKQKDLELSNPRYRIRANGTRSWAPVLTPAELAKCVYSMNNVRASDAGGVEATGKDASAVFKVEGANVIASMDIAAQVSPNATIAISTTNGIDWKPVYKNESESLGEAKIHLQEEVRTQYDVLVKVSLPEGGKLSSIKFDTITQVNSKTQPRLNIGKNVVYVGAGATTESIVLWPDLREGRTGPVMVDSSNIRQEIKTHHRYPTLYLDDSAMHKGWATFKVDAPTDIVEMTYGGRFYNRLEGSQCLLMHSFDGGKTWKEQWTLKDTTAPWDVIHHETVRDIPAGTRSVLFKYRLESREGSPAACGIYSARMEVNHKSADESFKPVDVTYTWAERQKDYSTIERSHTQKIEKIPFTYEINVGGADHPVMKSLRVNYAGAEKDLKYGYSDGKDVGGGKWVGVWATYGKNLAEYKPYTSSVPSLTNWNAGDPSGKVLTDGVVGSSYGGGKAYELGPIWNKDTQPEITVDLGETQKAAAFRIHIHGYEGKDAIKGEVQDKVEVLTSLDGKEFKSQGFFDFNLRWKDVPQNFMWNDEETFKAHNHTKLLDQPVETRYVKYKLTPARLLAVTEVQVLDGVRVEPFDIKIALPNGNKIAAARAVAKQ